MARALGNTLPDVLCSQLSGGDLSARMGRGILLTTSDAQGWPHPAMLSYGEVMAVDPRRLRLALYRTSGTSENLRRNGKLTLCLIEPGMVYYVKSVARLQQDPMNGFPGLARFEATVLAVLVDQAREDLEPGARITSGITFQLGRPNAEALDGWRCLLGELRREA